MACLADNRLGPSGAAVLCSALTQQQDTSSGKSGVGTSGLKELDISLNHLGDEGAKVRVSHATGPSERLGANMYACVCV